MNKYSNAFLMLKKKKLGQIIKKEKKIKTIAEEMNVSRQTVSKWLNRYRRFGEESLYDFSRKKYPPAHNKTSHEIEEKVISLAEKYWYDGVETLSDRLFGEQNIEMHSSTIYRILKRRKIRYDCYWNGTKKRRKKKLYCHKRLGQEIQVDTKYPFGYKIGLVIYTALDDCSRWSYAKLYNTANAKNTVDFLQHLQKKCLFPIKKIRTDNGTEFVNSNTKNYLSSNNIKWRRNTPYCPEENGKIERFHGTLNQKAISIFWKNTDSFTDLEYKLAQFLDYYNYRKKHRGIGMDGMTPFQKILFIIFSQKVNLTLQCNKI